MRSHPDAYFLYMVAHRTGTLDGCRVVAKLVCRRGHNLGCVRMIENRPVVAMRQRVQKHISADEYPAASRFEQRNGIRLFPRTETQLLLDVLDESADSAPAPLLRGDCSCRPPVKAVTREWLLRICQELDRKHARQRRVVLA